MCARVCVFIPTEGISGHMSPTEVHEATKDPERTVPLVFGLWSPSLWCCVLAILWEGNKKKGQSVTWTPAVWTVRSNLLTESLNLTPLISMTLISYIGILHCTPEVPWLISMPFFQDDGRAESDLYSHLQLYSANMH